MRAVLPVFLLCLVLPFVSGQEKISFPGNLKYDPFYSVQVTDSDGNLYSLHNASYLNTEGERKYFVWFRRGTDRGLAEYPLDLFKIASLELTGGYEVYPDGYTPCRVVLVSGSSYEGFLDTTGYLGGMDDEFGTFARIYLQYNGIKSVVFLQDGTYKRCPFCGALYYENDSTLCPFDKTPLTPQNP
jgi:hypothetical protein